MKLPTKFFTHTCSCVVLDAGMCTHYKAKHRNDMKRSPLFIVCMAFALLFSQKAWGQVSFYDARVSDYGQLEQVLGDKWNTVDSLIVHGPINEADFTTLWKCSFEGKLTVLNLEYAQVKDDKIPEYAFWKKDKQIIDDPRAYQGVVYLPIRRLILPDGIREIGDFAFSRMKLEQVNLPKSLRKLGVYSFSSCHWLSSDPLVIPEGITDIPAQCFVNCQCFDKLVLPSTLKYIGVCAFYNTRIEEVNLPEGLQEIKEGAFAGCDLKKVIIPGSLNELSGFLFSMCPYLEEIHIPDHITKIPGSFASWCPLLEKVNIPQSVIEIGSDAFGAAYKLKSIELPEGLKRIESNAFWYCAFDSIVFPASLEYLGGGSCAYWKYIKKIYSRSPIPPFCEEDKANPGLGPFHGYTPNDIPVYVPIGSGEKYRQAFGWSYFTNIIETDKLPTGIETPQVDHAGKYKIYGRDGRLVIEATESLSSPVSYAVYAIDGTLIAQGSFISSHSIPIPSRGTYIVRIGNSIHKALL